jgi:hypothetical protein
MIKADKTESIHLKEKYESEFGEVNIDLKIKFKKNTFPEDTEITMNYETETGVITFEPHMIFNKDAELEAKYDGVDLNGIDVDKVRFVFMNPNGNYETVEVHKVKVKVEHGSLTVNDGHIPHFSRYGFVTN